MPVLNKTEACHNTAIEAEGTDTSRTAGQSTGPILARLKVSQQDEPSRHPTTQGLAQQKHIVDATRCRRFGSDCPPHLVPIVVEQSLRGYTNPTGDALQPRGPQDLVARTWRGTTRWGLALHYRCTSAAHAPQKNSLTTRIELIILWSAGLTTIPLIQSPIRSSGSPGHLSSASGVAGEWVSIPVAWEQGVAAIGHTRPGCAGAPPSACSDRQ